MSMKVLIDGYYGFKNTGDELILSKIIDDIKTIDNNADIAVWSGNVKYTRTIHKVNAINRFSLNETKNSVKWSDVVIVGGGGLIQEYYNLNIEDLFTNFGYNVAAYAIVPFIANVYGKPVFYWSQGFGPIFSDEAKQFSNWFYSLANCTTVRDEYSYGLIKSIRPQIKNLYLDADPVVKLDISKFVEKEKFKLKKDKLKIGINLRPWFGQTNVVEKVAEALNRFIEEREDAIIVPVPFDLSFDTEILKKLLSNLPKDRVEQRYIDNIESPTDVLSLMNNVDIFIGTRLHSIIVANLLEKPAVAVIYDKKVESFIEQLSIPSVFIGTLNSFNVYTLIKKLAEGSIKVLENNIEYRTPEIFEKFMNGQLNGSNTLQKKDKPDSTFDNTQIYENFIQSLKDEINQLGNEKNSLSSQLQKSFDDYKAIKEEMTSRLNKIAAEKADIQAELEKMIDENKRLLNLLSDIYNSKFWKTAKIWYNIKNKTVSIFKKTKNSQQNDDFLNNLEKILSNRDWNGVVIYPPTVDWNIPLFQRPQHFALNFSKFDFLYFHCTPDAGYDDVRGFQKIEEGVYLTNEFSKLIEQISNYDISVYFILPSTNLTVDIDMLRHIKNDLGFYVIYDYIDEIHSSITYGNTNFIKERHEALTEKDFNLILCVSLRLFEEMKKKFNDNERVLLIENGVDYEHFHISKNPTEIPKKVKKIVDEKKPIIGYYGALAKWIDYDLLNYVAKKRQDINFLLIGVDYDGSLKQLNSELENMHYIGSVSYMELPFYAIWFDVAIIPFKMGNIAKSTSPLKMYEYMSLNKPLICTKDLLECGRYKTPLIAIDKSDFERKIDEALVLKDDENYIKLLNKEAKENTWEIRVKTIVRTFKGDPGSSRVAESGS